MSNLAVLVLLVQPQLLVRERRVARLVDVPPAAVALHAGQLLKASPAQHKVQPSAGHGSFEDPVSTDLVVPRLVADAAVVVLLVQLVCSAPRTRAETRVTRPKARARLTAGLAHGVVLEPLGARDGLVAAGRVARTAALALDATVRGRIAQRG